MIDGSSLPFEENIALTKKVVEYAHDHGVVVEGELGRLAGVEDEVSVEADKAMYTHPDHVRKGVGTTILALCEAAARQEGFAALELSATMAGVPLYRSFGFIDVRPFEDSGVPMILMRKAI